MAIIAYERQQKEREAEKFVQLPIITVEPEHIRTIPAEPAQLPPPAPSRNPVADAINAVYRDTK